MTIERGTGNLLTADVEALVDRRHRPEMTPSPRAMARIDSFG
jgi:hypothetical protein